jgi:hypothetical protein
MYINHCDLFKTIKPNKSSLYHSTNYKDVDTLYLLAVIPSWLPCSHTIVRFIL